MKHNVVWVDRDIITSKAYLSLIGFAPQLLMIAFSKKVMVLQKRKKHSGQWVCTNEKNLNLTYTEMKNKYNISQPRMARALDQLIEKGFLEVIHYGGATERDKSVYAFSEGWKNWEKGMKINERRTDKVARGFCRS